MEKYMRWHDLMMSIEQILKPGEYKIFCMSRDGYTQAEIGKKMDCCQKTISNKLGKIKMKLKEML